MGKAKDGSECYTRQGSAGGTYVTCEGTQKARKSKSKGRPSAPVRPAVPPPSKTPAKQSTPSAKKTYRKETKEKKIQNKVKQLDGRSWTEGGVAAKNPHKKFKMDAKGRVTTAQLKKIVKEYETDKTRKSELNDVIYEASKIVLKDRKVPLPKM
jgi:hypothetical protein|tara:strand:- start:13 stop:474 length:462 start_codon:yes stop_codon:yes gene_type:complete